MARTSKGPRYYDSKRAWYCTLNGETILLARGPEKETRDRAQEKYEQEVAARRVEVEGDRSTVWAVLNAYLLDLGNRVRTKEAAPSLLDMHTSFVTSFNEACGKVKVRDLRPQHVTEWLAAMRQERYNAKLKRATSWSAATEKMARDVVNRVFNWAVGEAGLISVHPLKRHPTPKAKRRKRRPSKNRVAISDHEHALLVEQARRRSAKGFLHLLTFMYQTGARPAEMYGVKADEWDEGKKAFIIKAGPESHGRFKLSHLGEDRVLYIPDDLVPLARELMAEYPEGTLFRNERGKAWKLNTICARFTSVKRAANRAAEAKGVPGVRKGVTAYGYRHAYVTDWVEAGKPLAELCELINTSETMVKQNYSHLFERTESLREALNSFDRGTAALPVSSPPVLAS